MQLGHEAPRQMEEAVASVGEGYGHDRPVTPSTRQATAAPHHPHALFPRPLTLADPG